MGVQRPAPQAVANPVREAFLGAVLLAFRLMTLPFALFYVLTGRKGRTFESIMQTACLVPASPGIFTRQAMLRWMARRCGRRVTVHIGTLFSSPSVELGENVYIGAFCNIGYARIDDYALIASNVQILSGKRQHGFERTDIPITLQSGVKQQVHIGYGAWIGNAAIVMADVGEEAIVGAGALVLDPVPAWSIAVGSPARVIGDRRKDRPTSGAAEAGT